MKKPAIEANEAADDIRAGFDDAALMKKYGLSARGLQSLFRKLISAGVFEQSEIDSRTSDIATSIIVDLVSPEEEEAASSGPPGERPRVIAISEDLELLSAVRNLLEQKDITIIACADADLNLFCHIRPQVALIDLDCEKNNSKELFVALRQADDLVPVVAMVDSVGTFAPQDFEGRIYDTVAKSIGERTFVAAVTRAIEHYELLTFKRDHEQAIKSKLHPETEEILDFLSKTVDVTVLTLAKMAEIRANGGSSNFNELRRVCRLLSEGAFSRPPFRDALTAKFIDDLVRSCVLHDIGKAMLPDSALHGEEWTDQETLRQHPVFGGRVLEEAAAKLDQENFFSVAKDMAYYHHENWDGSGYPFGLPGEEIPLAARILAIAEAYIRMTCGSPDQEPCSHEEACKRLVEGKGTKFDPTLVEVFLELDAR
jgi:response regulator RpfG family c-di-GMP phosphodiesterase